MERRVEDRQQSVSRTDESHNQSKSGIVLVKRQNKVWVAKHSVTQLHAQLSRATVTASLCLHLYSPIYAREGNWGIIGQSMSEAGMLRTV